MQEILADPNDQDYGPVKFMIKCFEANYPESLGVVLVHRSPWIFHSMSNSRVFPNNIALTLLGIWKIIRGWLDPVVASKVHFTKNLEELEEFVEKSHIPRELGGDDPWDYHYVEPIPGEDRHVSNVDTREQLLNERANLVKDYEIATQRWIQDPQSQAAIQQKRVELTKRLYSSYWKLDPYLRARSLYDRTGMIREGGIIQFYKPPTSSITSIVPNATNTPAQNGPLPAEQRTDDLD